MSREMAILVTLVVYNLVLVAIGVFSQRRNKDGVDYFLAGRNLSPLVAAISAAASSSSAWTLLGVSGAAYSWGVSALWLFPSCVGGFLINWFILAGPLQRLSHRTGAVTVTEVLAGPPDRPLHRTISAIASLIVLVSLAAYVASQFLSAGKTFTETFDMSLSASILIGGGVVVFYTLLGGFWAVSLTDTLQGLMMALTAVLLPAAALIAVGGPAELLQGLKEVDPEGYLNPIRSLPLISGIGFVLGLMGIGLGYPGQPHVVNRFMALKDRPNAVRRARRYAIVWAVIVYSGMLVLGLCGRVLFRGLADREVVFVVATNELFPPIVAGIMVAAVLAAVMSTADSQLLVAASTVTHDLKLGGANSRNLLFRSRLVVLLLSAGAMAAALLGSQEIFSVVLFAFTAMGAAFGPALVATALGRPVSPKRTVWAMSLGFGIAVTFYFFAATRGGPFDRILPFVVGLLIVLWPSRRRA